MNKLTIFQAKKICTIAQMLKEAGFSLAHRRKLKKRALFCIDKQPAAYNHLLQPGQTLEIKLAATTNVIAEQGLLNILYEDDYLLALNKPSGMLVHPTVGETSGTLANYLAAFIKDRADFDGLHFVSRLDRDTSGLVLAAKTAHMKYLLEKTKMHKIYFAVLTKIPPAKQGLINLPISRKQGSIIERTVSLAGKAAQTGYKIIKKYPSNACLVEFTAITGRTHQLRLHAKAIGCPIYGDSLYQEKAVKTRHFLHASKLVFLHPVTQEKVTIKSKLAPDIVKIILTF